MFNHEEVYITCRMCLNTAFPDDNNFEGNEFFKELDNLDSIELNENCCYDDNNLLYYCKYCNHNYHYNDLETPCFKKCLKLSLNKLFNLFKGLRFFNNN
jgi:hypothetical protein